MAGQLMSLESRKDFIVQCSAIKRHLDQPFQITNQHLFTGSELSVLLEALFATSNALKLKHPPIELTADYWNQATCSNPVLRRHSLFWMDNELRGMGPTPPFTITEQFYYWSPYSDRRTALTMRHSQRGEKLDFLPDNYVYYNYGGWTYTPNEIVNVNEIFNRTFEWVRPDVNRALDDWIEWARGDVLDIPKMERKNLTTGPRAGNRTVEQVRNLVLTEAVKAAKDGQKFRSMTAFAKHCGVSHRTVAFKRVWADHGPALLSNVRPKAVQDSSQILKNLVAESADEDRRDFGPTYMNV